jgi:hypothetical protein
LGKNWNEGTILRHLAEVVHDEWGFDITEDDAITPETESKTLGDVVTLLHKRIVRRSLGLDVRQMELPGVDEPPKPKLKSADATAV